ncbi:hypothetical protein CTI12_AA143020 [Artemisia annua]|uniref:DUF659 domain-containing protein n=1 Tax=Artemisia annua TaxID=35608 RepID=A0A2U1NLG2_ARTAN|nr:hypothetical protein CTI12_AA143020 [Artemisia annua]
MPSSEKARTVLLDECARVVEKDLVPIKDTWYAQGLSILSDGWSNVKHKPLINILVVNSRGATFMYSEDFSIVEKTGVEISKFLLESIESIGLSNLLQVVIDNATNCTKAAGEEVKKIVCKIIRSNEFLEDAKMGEVYEMMDNMIGEIKEVMQNVYTSYFQKVEKIV